jgi:hypothetical protein
MDYCPFVDHETLYFTSKRSKFEEVNDFQSLDSLIETLNQSENGMSKIYQMSFKTVPSSAPIKNN